MQRFLRHPLSAALAAALLVGTSSAAPRPEQTLLAAIGSLRSDAMATPRARRAPASTTIVSNCNDSGPGSLRDAIATAGASSSNDVDMTALTCGTITLTTGAIVIPAAGGRMDILGPGRDALTIDAGDNSRVFESNVDSYVTLYDMTITNGNALGNGGCVTASGGLYLRRTNVHHCHAYSSGDTFGGAVYSAGKLILDNVNVSSGLVESNKGYAKGGGVFAHDLDAFASTVDQNEATTDSGYGFGGGVFATANLTIESSTISNNVADSVGGVSIAGKDDLSFVTRSTIADNRSRELVGGIYTYGPLQIDNSTIAFNCAAPPVAGADPVGVGLHAVLRAPTLASSIVSNNQTCVSANNSSAPLDDAVDVSVIPTTLAIAGDHDLVTKSGVTLPSDTIRSDPALYTLADNGGPTMTIALSGTSAALNHGSNAHDAASDQRGFPFARVVGTGPDIGAFEVQSTGVTRAVTNCADTDDGSLRAIAASALSGDIIDLRDSHCSSIALGGEIALPQGNVTLIGPGAAYLTIDAAHQGRALNHSGQGTLKIDGLAFENGHTTEAYGGCIKSAGRLVGSDFSATGCAVETPTGVAGGGAVSAYSVTLTDARISHSSVNSTTSGEQAAGGGVFASKSLELERVTLSDNAVSSSGTGIGGGFYAQTAVISDSTISANRAIVVGAGAASTMLELRNSTVSGNSALVAVGGVFGRSSGKIISSTIAFNSSNQPASTPIAAGAFFYDHVELESSIISGNTQAGTAYDIGARAAVISGSHNVVGFAAAILPPDTLDVDPLLAPLADNGGPTETHALLPGSRAIDGGDNTVGAFENDQRGPGFPRVTGPAADIGAFETGSSPDGIFHDGFDGIP